MSRVWPVNAYFLLSREVGHTTGVYVPYSLGAVACVLLRSTWTDQCRKVLWHRTCGFSSSSEKTRKSNRSQMSLQRQHFLLIYLKILSVGPAGVWTRDLPLRGPALYQLTELTRRPLINQDWSNIQSKNYGDNSLMSQECTGGIMLVPRERHKMKWKTDKTIDHQRHFVHFLWTSNRGQQVYDMQPRPQGFSLKKWVGREKALASAGHVSPRTP